ncbi:hypothetical protein [Pseudanabaena sp. 'Roaring Creek']|uniref:hypothetical protein n=1 Tax=Pseudanabaena sp. 'Roaring Creek' TaxID=1681830 RepID=UPI0006D7A606|nr:hypothetical protein [Pseudanabaena sp. 'Roaring Creek']
MEIKLLSSPAKQIAEDILKGALPPETYDIEVIYWLLHLEPNLTVYRIDEFNQNGGGDERLDIPIKVVFSANQIKIALENDIEMRPQLR